MPSFIHAIAARRIPGSLARASAALLLAGCAPAVLRLGPTPELRPAIAAVERTGTRAARVVLDLPAPGYVTLFEVVSTSHVTLLRVADGASDTLLAPGRHELALGRGPSAVAPRLRHDMQPQPEPGAVMGGEGFVDVGRAPSVPCPDAPPSASSDPPRCLEPTWAGAAPVAPRYFLVAVVTGAPVDDRALEAALRELPVGHRADDLVEAATRLAAAAAGSRVYGAEAKELEIPAR